MVEYQYGSFSDEQVEAQKKSLHSAIFWLLLYRDPKSADEYKYVDVDEYIDSLMLQLGGLNDLFGQPPVMVTIMSKLMSLKKINQHEPFDYRMYRKIVLDVQALINKLPDKGGDADGV